MPEIQGKKRAPTGLPSGQVFMVNTSTQSLCICQQSAVIWDIFKWGEYVENEDRASRLSRSTRRKAQHLLAQSKRNKEQGGNLQLSGGTPPRHSKSRVFLLAGRGERRERLTVFSGGGRRGSEAKLRTCREKLNKMPSCRRHPIS